MDELDQVFEILRNSFKHGGKLLLCGNGGSAADCDHIAAELMKDFRFKHNKGALQDGLPAISLCSNTALITAIANDIGYKYVFAQQVHVLGKPRDVLLILSTSGRSENIKLAEAEAKSRRMRVIIWVGTQEWHRQFYHQLCERLEEEFFK